MVGASAGKPAATSALPQPHLGLHLLHVAVGQPHAAALAGGLGVALAGGQHELNGDVSSYGGQASRCAAGFISAPAAVVLSAPQAAHGSPAPCPT